MNGLTTEDYEEAFRQNKGDSKQLLVKKKLFEDEIAKEFKEDQNDREMLQKIQMKKRDRDSRRRDF